MFRQITTEIDRRVAETHRSIGWLFPHVTAPTFDPIPWRQPVVSPEFVDPTPLPVPRLGWLFSVMVPPPPPPGATTFPAFVHHYTQPTENPPGPDVKPVGIGWLYSTMAPAPPPPPATGYPPFRRWIQDAPDPQETYTGPQNPSRWTPAMTSPSPFVQNLLAGRIVPRVPIRYKPGGGFGDSEGGDDQPEKIDPRSVRFTEIVGDILNGLIGTGAVYKSGVSTWGFAFIPRQVTPANSFTGEIFYNSTTNILCYKDPFGVVHPLY